MILKLVKEIYPEALGEDGEHGDASYISYVATRLVDIYKCLMKWTLDHEMLIVPDELSNYMMVNARLNSTLIEDLASFFEEIIKGKETVDTLADDSEIEIMLTLRPPNVEYYMSNLNVVRQLLG